MESFVLALLLCRVPTNSSPLHGCVVACSTLIHNSNVIFSHFQVVCVLIISGTGSPDFSLLCSCHPHNQQCTLPSVVIGNCLVSFLVFQHCNQIVWVLGYLLWQKRASSWSLNSFSSCSCHVLSLPNSVLCLSTHGSSWILILSFFFSF